MLAKRVLFVGVGAAGGNITKLLKDKGYYTYFVNTNKDDLDSLQIEDDIRFKVPMARGCSKDRDKAIGYTKKYYDMIVNEIEDKFDFMDIVFFIFSTGGGTGSGVTPALLDIFSRRNPKKSVGAIVALPAMYEDQKAKKNTIECLTQLYSRPKLKNVYVLDNNHRQTNKKINQSFVEYMDALINITSVDTEGIVDESEMEKFFDTRGSVILADAEGFNKSIEQSIFTDHERGCKYIAVSSNQEVNKADITGKLGVPAEYLRGHNRPKIDPKTKKEYTYKNIVAAFGMKFPYERLDKYDTSVKEEETEHIESVELEKTYDIPDVKKSPEKQTEEPGEIDFDKLWAEFE